MPIRPSSISPGTFTTALSIESDRSHRDIILYSGNVLVTPYSPLSYHLAVARIATIVQPYRNRTCPVSVEAISKSIQDLDVMDQTLPPYLSAADGSTTSSKAMNNSWIETQRNLLLVLIESCRLTLCLAALPEILDTEGDAFNLQYIGRHAAIKIVEQRQKYPSAFFAKFWGPRVGMLSAGIYLILDLLCFRAKKSLSETERSLTNVSFALQLLKNGPERDQSGSQILERLLHLFNSSTADWCMNKQTLLGLMTFAGGASATQHERHPDEESPHDPQWLPGAQGDIATQTTQVFDDGLLSQPNGIPEQGIDFDGFNFDLFQHMWEGGIDWSNNTLPIVPFEANF